MESIPELHLLIRKGHYHAVRFTINRKNVNVRDQDGKTPLILCCQLEDEGMAVGIARMLIEKGGKIGLDDKSGVNALMYAVLYGRSELVEVYLGAMDYELNQRDRIGNTALFYAASLGSAEVLRQIVTVAVRYGVSVDVANREGMTPLLESCRLAHDECSRLLVEEGGASEVVRDKVWGKNSHQWRMEYMVASLNAKAGTDSCTPRPRTSFVSRFTKNSSRTATAASSFTQIRPKTAGRKRAKKTRVYDPSADLPPPNWPDHIRHEKIKVKFRMQALEEIYSSTDIARFRRKSFPVANRLSVAATPYEDSGHCKNWKKEMNSLYNNFAYQVSNSYRKKAVSKKPSIPELVTEPCDLFENDSETSSRRGLRRLSVYSNSSLEDRSEDGLSPIRPPKGLSRRMSVTNLEDSSHSLENIPRKALGRRKSMMVGIHESGENLLSVSSSSSLARRRLSVPSAT